MITAVLRNRFIYPFRPVLLSSLIKPFDGIEFKIKFLKIVEEFLPEESERLMRMQPVDADKAFIEMFSKKYFHIDSASTNETPLTRLTRNIPVKFHGLNDFNYDHRWWMKDSQLLAASICRKGAGSRIAVIDVLYERCPQAAKMVTKDGYEPEIVEMVLKGTKYEELTIWCKWVFHMTGNEFLDKTSGSSAPAWTKTNVNRLVKAWPEYKSLQIRMDKFETWLKEDFVTRSVEVIEFINNKVKAMPVPLSQIFGVVHGNEG